MSNGPAKNEKIDTSLQECGELICDPYEVSNIRREDYKAYKGKNEYEDILQISGNKGGGRGHQGPAAFLIMGSGLDKVNYLFYFKQKKYMYLFFKTLSNSMEKTQRIS